MGRTRARGRWSIRALGLGWAWLAGAHVALARDTATLATGWKFHLGDVAGGEGPALDDSTWPAVTLPHTWNAGDGQRPDYVRGLGWYRLRLASVPSERAFLRFGAASQSAEVYLDGVRLGRHDGGFTAFAFDATSALASSGEHVLAVKVSNAFNADLAPVDADFTFFGGLYRDVTLVTTPAVHVSLADHGSLGVYAETTQLDGAQAHVHARVVIANDGTATPATLSVDLVDAQGVVAAHATRPLTLAAASSTTVATDLTVTSAHAWNGVADPYLYQLVATVAAGDGATSDRVAQPFGLRRVTMTPDGGTLLNGRPLEVRGVSLHQDWAGKGWALGETERRASVDLAREMGANAVRLAHYPHHPDELALYDARGMLAWSEIPLVNTITASDAFTTSTKSQLVEMIRQLYNHPSIAWWGLFNEVKADPAGLVAALNDLAHREDPTRPTVAASDRPLDFPLHAIPDALAFNKYDGWYYRGLGDFGPEMDAAHAAFPGKPIGVSEYGAGANPTQHADVLATDEPPRLHPEERQSAFHEAFLEQLAARPYLFAHFVWNMADFASATRNEGGIVGLNDKGLVSYDRSLKKDAFYLYQAAWTATPTLHVTSRRFSPRSAGTTTLKVYSNLASLVATLGGVGLGPPSLHRGVVWTWDAVRLDPGTSRIEVVGTTASGVEVRDGVTWTVTP